MSGHLQRTSATRNFPKGGWEARWQEDLHGRLRWRGKTFTTKKEAERHLAAVLTDISRGDHIASSDSGRRFTEAAELWKGSLGTTRREKTVHDYLSTLRVHVMPRWREQRLSTITHNDVQLWIDQQLRDGKSSAQIIKGYRVLRMVLGRAVKAGWVRTNPCASDLDLLRLRTAIDHLLQQPSRILAIRWQLHVGQVVDYLNLGFIRFHSFGVEASFCF